VPADDVTTSVPVRLAFERHAPAAYRALARLDWAVTERERAALAFTEAVTLMNVDHVPDPAYEAVSEHYDEDEVAALVSLIVAINAWNAIGVSTHTWVPGSYKP
jgi:alkylhydroperoxidase family enzyme